MDLLAKLGINWGLLLAQGVNFTLLLGVLSVFLYKPVFRLIDQRRELVRKSVADAKKLEQQLREMDRIRSERIATLDRECGEILAKTKCEAEQVKQEFLTLAQREADRILEKGRASLAQERTRVMTEVSSTLSTLILRATEAILRREFTDADQRRLLKDVEHHLTSLRR